MIILDDFSMKKFVLFTLLFVLSVPCFSQRDLKTLVGKSPKGIISLYGIPEVEDNSLIEYMCPVVFYQNKKFYFEESETGTWICSSIENCDPSICVLTSFIDGGVKIGDPFSKLECLGDRLQPNLMKYEIISHPASHVVFKEEYQSYYFSVENGIITAFSLLTKEDSI